MPIFFKTPWPAVWESLSLRPQKNRRRSMPEPVDLDARHRLGGHGTRAHRRLMGHCQLNQFTSLRFRQPARQAAPVIAAAMSPRPGTRARGSAAALGQAGHRANPARPGLHNAKYPPPAANITSSRENANARPGRITGSQGCPRPCGGVEQKGLGHGTQPARPGVHVTATHTGSYPPPTDLTGADDHMTGLTGFASPSCRAACASWRG
jgi:hypothetical protein